jgi:heat shock protein HslJ
MGGYELKGAGIRFQTSMATTMMACPEPLMSQEQAVHAALASVASYRREAAGLDLLDPNGEVLLRLAVLEPVALVGPVWQLEAYNNGKQAIVSLLAGTQVTLELRDNGTLGGSDGCNRYMSGFTLEGDTLTFGPIATTRMACRGPAGAAEQAAAYAAALGTVTGYRIEGEELVLLNREGGSAARFRVEH